MTRIQAIDQVLKENTGSIYRVWKHRMKKGKLSIEAQHQILLAHGFRQTKEESWDNSKKTKQRTIAKK